MYCTPKVRHKTFGVQYKIAKVKSYRLKLKSEKSPAFSPIIAINKG